MGLRFLFTIPESVYTITVSVYDFQPLTSKKIILLERDGGSIELSDIEGNTVKVRLKGRCAACHNAGLTLKKLVESKLREFVSEHLTVEEA